MKETQNNKNTEANQLNEELGKEIEKVDFQSGAEFQGYEPKVEKPKKKREKKKPKKTKKQILKRVLIVLAVIILVPIIAFVTLRILGKSSLFSGKVNMKDGANGAEVQNNGDLVIYKGHKYRYNENITSVLFMGVDRENISSDEKTLKEHGAGQADTMFLAAYDSSSDKVSLISIPRDTMADVKTYDEKGKYIGTKKTQLCLAYAYGDGREKSCENTVDAVSKELYGIPIDSYVSINLSAISILNDAIGGVNVQVIGDLTDADPDLKEGANITLLGDQAETYVRTREHEPLDANLERMKRQQQYMTAFIQKTLRAVRDDITLPLDLLNLVSDNTVTDISASELTYLGTEALGVSFASDDIHTIECKIEEGKTGYAEYYPDETKLFELVLDVFYTQVD